MADPIHHMKDYGNGVIAPEKTPSVKAAEALHYHAKANAEMYKAQMPVVYTHQTPYVYNPVVYKAPEAVKPVTYTAPVAYTHSVAAPVTYTHQVAAPITYTHSVAAPVTYTHTYPYAPQVYHTLHKRDVKAEKREAEVEEEAGPAEVFYSTYGYWPHQVFAGVPYTYIPTGYNAYYPNYTPSTYTYGY